MKKFVNAVAFAIVLGAPTLAGSAVPPPAQVLSQTLLDPWTECQYAYYADCMAHHGDHVLCYYETSQVIC